MAFSKNDLSQIRKIFDEELDNKLDEKLDEKLTQFRSDMYNRLDEILKEFLASRERTNNSISQGIRS